MTTDELRARIQAACDAAVAKGWRITGGTWIRRGATNCCCPLGAVVLGTAPEISPDLGPDQEHNIALVSLGVSSDWIFSFTLGFDRGVGRYGRYGRYSKANALGREFREKYKEA